MKSVRKITAPLLLVVAFLLSATFVPTLASASTVNSELASNPTAVIAEIEKIGLPMSDEMAGEMRGEVAWPIIQGLFYTGVALGIAWNKLYPYAMWCYSNCSNIYEAASVYKDAIGILLR